MKVCDLVKMLDRFPQDAEIRAWDADSDKYVTVTGVGVDLDDPSVVDLMTDSEEESACGGGDGGAGSRSSTLGSSVENTSPCSTTDTGTVATDAASNETSRRINATSTSEMTPEEIAAARAFDQLTVNERGLGSVPTEWLRRWRASTKEVAKPKCCRYGGPYHDPLCPEKGFSNGPSKKTAPKVEPEPDPDVITPTKHFRCLAQAAIWLWGVELLPFSRVRLAEALDKAFATATSIGGDLPTEEVIGVIDRRIGDLARNKLDPNYDYDLCIAASNELVALAEEIEELCKTRKRSRQ